MDSFRRKKNKNPIVLIACRVFQTLIEDLLPDNLADRVTFLDYGLHVVPKNLTKELQHAIDQIEDPSFIVLGYGLCGNGLVGIKSGKHTLLVPRTDDCIAILLGSYDAYRDVFSTEPGTYYLTKGWLEAGSNPLQEYRGYVEKYGPEKADMIMDLQYQNYSRLLFVAHDQDDLEQYHDQVIEIASFCQRWDMRFEKRLGSARYIRRLINLVEGIYGDGIDLNDDDFLNDFVFIQPNNEIEQKFFLR
jgi:hypothetical protein